MESIVKLDLTAIERDSDTGEIRVNVGSSDTGEGYGAAAAMWGADGFFGMPNEPSDDGACVGLVHIDGNNRRVLATKDNRFVGKYASLQAGDRAIVTDGPSRLIMKKATKSISLYTEDDDGNVQVFDLSGSKGSCKIMIGGPDGTAMFQMKSGEISIGVDGGGTLLLNKDGFFLTGGYGGINAGRGNLGVVGQVAPLAPAQGIAFSASPGSASLNWTVAP